MQTSSQATPPIKVFIIAGQRILLWGIEQLIIGKQPDMRHVGSAVNVEAALSLLASAEPDVILYDLDIMHAKSSDLADLMASTAARVLVMTRQDDERVLDQAILDGARGVLDRHASPEVMLEAIAKVHQGQYWLDRAATGRIFVAFSQRGSVKAADPDAARVASLTDREKRIIACIFENTEASAKAIAERLHISESTLRNHLTSIYGKLGVANRFGLIAYALKHTHIPGLPQPAMV